MFQKLIIVGNLGGDPEMRYMPNGDPVTNFSLATNRRWTDKDGNQVEEATWFRVSVWGKSAEACNQYLTKGRQVLVEGQLVPDKGSGNPRVWTDTEGNARASFDVRAYNVLFLGGAQQLSSSNEVSTNPVPRDPVSTDPAPVDTDEIPF